MPLYTIHKFQDTYKVTNTGEDTILLVVEIQEEGCSTYDVVKHVSLNPGIVTTVSLVHDGQYRFRFIEGEDESQVLISHYFSLIKSIVSNIQYILCDCAEGSECDDCDHTKECSLQLTTMLKIFSYQRLTHPQHAAFIEAVFEVLQCSVNELTSMVVLEEQTTGSAEYIELLKKIISFYYLAFYYSEFQQAGSSQHDYINSKFEFERISQCIDADLLQSVQNKINNMATFTVQTGVYRNLPPEIGDNTIEVDNNVTTVLTLSMFTSQTNPPYNDPEGDPVDALRIDSISEDNQGAFYFDDVPVTVGQIISAEAIEQERFVHRGAEIHTIANDTIGFSLRDTGSMVWST